MTYEELLELARRCEGLALETVTGKRFTVGIYRDCPFLPRRRAARRPLRFRACQQ